MNRLLAGQDEVAQKERTMGNTPKNKYSEVVKEVKKALTIILAQAQILLNYEIGLSDEGIGQLNEIKHQSLKIDGLVEKIK